MKKTQFTIGQRVVAIRDSDYPSELYKAGDTGTVVPTVWKYSDTDILCVELDDGHRITAFKKNWTVANNADEAG